MFNFFKKQEGAVLADHETRGEEITYRGKVRPKESWKERHTNIRLAMILYISWKNLRVSRMRSVLTIGGVALGIGIITFLLSMGFGVQRLIVNEVTKDNPVNVIDVNNGNLDNFVTLNDDTIKKIKSLGGIENVEVRVNTGGKIILNESQTDVVIYGTTKNYLDMARINYSENGGKFSDGGNSVVISDSLAKLLGFGNPYDAIGKTVKYNIALSKDISSGLTEEKVSADNETTIIGVTTNADGVFMYFPFEFLKNNFGIDGAQEGKVAVSDMANFGNIQQQLEQMGFITSSINELVSGINDFFNTVRVFLVIFGIIIMSISVMGMLNTLSVSLLQRTKEIGILKALGTKRMDVFKMFVLESIIISLVGGILGFFGGYGFALLINKIMIILGHRMGSELSYFVYIPPSFIISIGGFIIFLGIITGIMPAFRAAKIHALEALRYE